MLQMIMNSIIDHIPMWVWLTVSGCALGAALYFFSPILIPLWRVLPGPVKALLIALATAAIAFLGGRYRGRANAEEEERQRNAEALQKRAQVQNETDKMSDKEVGDDLRDRWTRD